MLIEDSRRGQLYLEVQTRSLPTRLALSYGRLSFHSPLPRRSLAARRRVVVIPRVSNLTGTSDTTGRSIVLADPITIELSTILSPPFHLPRRCIWVRLFSDSRSNFWLHEFVEYEIPSVYSVSSQQRNVFAIDDAGCRGKEGRKEGRKEGKQAGRQAGRQAVR